jgi:uncharacterized membrane protein YciS (DUF1049 family)
MLSSRDIAIIFLMGLAIYLIGMGIMYLWVR